MNTKKDNVIVTVNWIYNDLVKRKKISQNKTIVRIVKLCESCGMTVFKDEPKEKNFFWTFNKIL